MSTPLSRAMDQMAEVDRLIEENIRLQAEIERLKDQLRRENAEHVAVERFAQAEIERLIDAEAKLEQAQAVIDSYYGCEIEPRMAAFLREFRAALAAEEEEEEERGSCAKCGHYWTAHKSSGCRYCDSEGPCLCDAAQPKCPDGCCTCTPGSPCDYCLAAQPK